MVLASTGVRVGELLGLWWNNVNFDPAEVNVAWAITDGGPGVRIVRQPTKRADWRDVPLTDGAIAAFRAQLGRRCELLGAEPIGHAYVFPGGIDPVVLLRPERLQGRWIAARGSSLVTLGQFRYYAATALLDAGESYRTVADILGNSESTLRLHYDGRTDVGKRKAIAALELGGRRG
jgi:integrase